MRLHIREKEKDNHYFYVMGWRDKDMKSAPIKRCKFDIYDEAVKFFKDIIHECRFVQMFERIGNKRKWIADTDDMSAFE